MSDVVLKLSGKMRQIDLIEDDAEELVDDVEDDVEDLDDDDSEVVRVEYQIWLLGYDEEENCTGWDYQIDWYEDLVEAQKCFDFFTREPLSVIKNKDENFKIPEDVKKVCLTLEEVFFDADDEEIETNIENEYMLDKEANEE